MKWPVIGLLLTGIAAAFCAALLLITTGFGGPKAAKSAPVSILVAGADLPVMSVLGADSIKAQPVLNAQVPRDALREPVQAVGRVLAVPLKAGQAITERSLAPEGDGAEIAARLQPGMRAVAVALPDSAGLEAVLYPGSVVDVIVSFKMQSAGGESRAVSTTLLQNIPVLAVDKQLVGGDNKESRKDGGKKSPAVPRSPAPTSRRARKVTLMVDAQQAESLQLATGYGEISLAMRNPLDRREVVSDATVLNAGRLAKLAEFLQPQLASDSESHKAADPTGESSEAHAFATPSDAPSAAQWEVLVVRGIKTETQKFPAPPVGGGAAQP